MFAGVVHARLEHPRLALRTGADRFVPGEIDGHRAFARVVLLVAEIELELVLRRELEHRGERKTLPAAKALQRPQLAVADERLDLGGLHDAAREKFRQAEVALRALEPAIIFLHRRAAFRTRRFQVAIIAGDILAGIGLGRVHDAARHVGDLRHEHGAR